MGTVLAQICFLGLLAQTRFIVPVSIKRAMYKDKLVVFESCCQYLYRILMSLSLVMFDLIKSGVGGGLYFVLVVHHSQSSENGLK